LCLFTSGREAFACRHRTYWSYSWEINCFHTEEKYPSPSPFSFLLFAPSSTFRPIRQSPKVN
jgi:phosphatidylserine decarboxylase